MLSGFVIGYAYDDRRNSTSVGSFIKRRVIRLHPMVIVGALFGAVMFYGQGSEYLNVQSVSLALLAFATLLNMLLVPAWSGVEVRGFGEIFPLKRTSMVVVFRVYSQSPLCVVYPKTHHPPTSPIGIAMAGALWAMP